MCVAAFCSERDALGDPNTSHRVHVCVYLGVSQTLVVDLVQDDHAVGGDRLLPPDVHRVLCHRALDGTGDVVGFVCRKGKEMNENE